MVHYRYDHDIDDENGACVCDYIIVIFFFTRLA